MAAVRKEIRKMVSAATWLGWTVLDRKHYIFRCPCGRHSQISIASTPSAGRRSLENAVALLTSERLGECAIPKEEIRFG